MSTNVLSNVGLILNVCEKSPKNTKVTGTKTGAVPWPKYLSSSSRSPSHHCRQRLLHRFRPFSASPSYVDCCVGCWGSRQSESDDVVIVVFFLHLTPFSPSCLLSPSHRRCQHFFYRHPFRVIIISWLLCWGVRQSKRDDVFIVLVDGFVGVAPPPTFTTFPNSSQRHRSPPLIWNSPHHHRSPPLSPVALSHRLWLVVAYFFAPVTSSYRHRRLHIPPPLSLSSNLIVDCVRKLPPPSTHTGLRQRRGRHPSPLPSPANGHWRCCDDEQERRHDHYPAMDVGGGVVQRRR